MQEESFILVPVTIPQSDLEAFINQSLPLELYSGSEEELGFEVTTNRKGPIKVRMEDHEVFYDVDLEVEIRKSTILSDINGKGRLNLQLKTSFTITEDWLLDSQTVLEYYKWIEAPKVKVGIATIPVKKLTDGFLKRNREKITAAIDQTIYEKVRLADYIQLVWEKLNESVDIKDPVELHFLMRAKAVMLSPITGMKDNIRSFLFLPVKPILKFGRQLENEITAFPSFSYHYEKDDHFVLHIPADLPYNMATRLASENLRGKTMEVQGQTLQVESIQVEKNDGKVQVDIGFSGNIRGMATARFNPVFSPGENKLVLKDLSFDLKTKNVLAKGAIWLFKERIIQTIQENAALFLTSLKKDIRDIIQKELDDLVLPEMAELEMDLSVFDIAEIKVKEESLVFQTILKGKGKLLLHLMKARELSDT